MIADALAPCSQYCPRESRAHLRHFYQVRRAQQGEIRTFHCHLLTRLTHHRYTLAAIPGSFVFTMLFLILWAVIAPVVPRIRLSQE